MISGREKLLGLQEDWRKFVTYCLEECDRAGLRPLVRSGKRTSVHQAKLRADYLAGRSNLPAAPAGRSAHEYGLAVDVWSQNGRQAELIAIFKKYGAETVPNDPPHFQYPGFKRWLDG